MEVNSLLLSSHFNVLILETIFNWTDVLLGFQITSQFPSRYRTRSTSVNSERYSTSESVDLQSPSSPQQLRNLGKSP